MQVYVCSLALTAESHFAARQKFQFFCSECFSFILLLTRVLVFLHVFSFYSFEFVWLLLKSLFFFFFLNQKCSAEKIFSSANSNQITAYSLAFWVCLALLFSFYLFSSSVRVVENS